MRAATKRTLLADPWDAVLAFRVDREGAGCLPPPENCAEAGMWMKSWSRGTEDYELNGLWRSTRESRDPLSAKAGLLYSLQQKGLTRFGSKSLSSKSSLQKWEWGEAQRAETVV